MFLYFSVCLSLPSPSFCYFFPFVCLLNGVDIDDLKPCVCFQGWKFSDMMFATRRSLSDACGNVSKRLENVYTSISASVLWSLHFSYIWEEYHCHACLSCFQFCWFLATYALCLEIIIMNQIIKYLAKTFFVFQATKRHLSSRIDIVDSKVDECAENTAATKDEV